MSKEIELEIPVVGGVTYEPQNPTSSGRATGVVSLTTKIQGTWLEKIVRYAENSAQRCDGLMLDELLRLAYGAGFDDATREAQEKVSGAAAFVEARMGALAEITSQRDALLVDAAQHVSQKADLKLQVVALQRELEETKGFLSKCREEKDFTTAELTKLQERFDERGEALRIATESQITAENTTQPVTDEEPLLDKILSNVSDDLLVSIVTDKDSPGKVRRFTKEYGAGLPDSHYMAQELLSEYTRANFPDYKWATLYVPVMRISQEVTKSEKLHNLI